MRASCTEFNLPRSTEEPDSILRSFLNPGEAGRLSREDGGDAAAGEPAEENWPCGSCTVLQSHQLQTNARCFAADCNHFCMFGSRLASLKRMQNTGSLSWTSREAVPLLLGAMQRSRCRPILRALGRGKVSQQSP